MRYGIFLLLLFIAYPSAALGQERYLQPGKILYEDPREDDVLRVNVSIGYTTVLEFSKKPLMVTTGDSSLIQTEVPRNSKNVLIKALRDEGETNLFVFTPDRRFNYKVVVGDKQDVDYVIDVKETLKDQKITYKKIPINQLIKMAKNYRVLKETDQINPRLFVKKDIFKGYTSPRFNLKVMEAFSNKEPHYLILHVVIHNRRYSKVKLNEKNTNVYVNGQKFKPQYILFDSNELGARQGTVAWLVLENTFVSLDNHFTIGVGVYDKEYIF